MTAKAATDWVIRGLIAFATLSLGSNSWLIRDKVTEMAADIKTVAIGMADLKTAQAVDHAALTAAVQRLDTQNERLQNVEHTVTEMSALFRAKARR